MILIIKLILICLSNSFFNSFMKTKNEKRTVFRFPFFYENVKRMKVLKIQTKNLLNMKMTVNYLNFVFRIEVKTKSKYRILNFVFQFIKNTKWYFGYTDLHWWHNSTFMCRVIRSKRCFYRFHRNIRNLKPFKSDEKCFLFNLKSSYCSKYI